MIDNDSCAYAFRRMDNYSRFTTWVGFVILERNLLTEKSIPSTVPPSGERDRSNSIFQMALALNEQLKNLITERRHHLVAFRADASHGKTHSAKDAIASALALADFLRAHGKTVDVVAHGFSAPRQLRFLKDVEKITKSPQATQQTVITVDLNDTGIKSLSYDVEGDMLSIYLTPKKGSIAPKQVRTGRAAFPYDCVWVVDTQDFASLGSLYTNNTDLFHNVPTVVLDHSSANEHFGTINMVDITAASTAEVVYTLCNDIAKEHITPTVAQALLTGIIAKTKSFKTSKMNPRTFALVSTLMELGAKRDEIVDHLFRQRPLSTLKLWGSALTRLTHDAQHKLAVVTIPKDEFIRAGAHEDELPEIIDELISNSPEARVIALLYESPKTNKLCGVVYTDTGLDSRHLTEKWQGTGSHEIVEFCMDEPDLINAQNHLTEHLQNQIRNLG